MSTAGNLQGVLPGFGDLLSRNAIGAWGEIHVANALERQGYEVKTIHGSHQGDVWARNPQTGEIHCIEVKTARQGKDGKWRFTLRKKGHADHSQSTQVVLLALTKSGIAIKFVIPTSAITNRNHICLTSHPANYSGRFAPYRQFKKLDVSVWGTVGGAA